MKLPLPRRTVLIFAAVTSSAAAASQDRFPATVNPDLADRVEAAVHTLASGSRITGYPGNARAASFIAEGLRRHGCVDVRREQYSVAVPVEEGSRLVLSGSGEVIPVFGLWPNHVRTTTTPPEGIELPLVYGGWGEFADFEGLPLDGSAVLMEFNSWDHWTRAARFGARAFIFIEPEDTGYLQTLDKFTSVPLDIPRFWIDRGAGLKLRRLVAGGDPVSVEIHSRMDWREQPAWNIWGKVVGSDPELREQTIVVDAYYDGISVVPALAPSAETSCSIVALLELARHLQSNPPARTVILSATGAHFQGQRGMIDFLDRHARKNEEYAKWMEEPLDVDLFISLDLSSRTDQVAVWNNSDRFELKRLFVPFSRRFTRYAREAASAQGREPTAAFANGISPIKGIDWSTLAPGGVPTSGMVAMNAGQLALSFVTTHDARLFPEQSPRPSRGCPLRTARRSGPVSQRDPVDGFRRSGAAQQSRGVRSCPPRQSANPPDQGALLPEEGADSEPPSAAGRGQRRVRPGRQGSPPGTVLPDEPGRRRDFAWPPGREHDRNFRLRSRPGDRRGPVCTRPEREGEEVRRRPGVQRKDFMGDAVDRGREDHRPLSMRPRRAVRPRG